MAPPFPVTEAYTALYLSFPKIERRMTVENTGLHAHRLGQPGMLSTQVCLFSRRDVYLFRPEGWEWMVLTW